MAAPSIDCGLVLPYDVDTFILYNKPERRDHLLRYVVPRFRGKALLWKGTTQPFNGMTDSAKIALGCKGMLSILSEMADREGPFRPFMILEDDVDVSAFYERMDRPQFSFPADADALYFGVSSSEMFFSGVHNNCRSPAFNLNQQWARVHRMLGSHAVMITSRRFMNFLIRAYSHCHGINSIGQNFGYDLPVAMHLHDYNVYGLRVPLFYQRKIGRDGQDLGGQQELTAITLDPAMDQTRPYDRDAAGMPRGRPGLIMKWFWDFEPFAGKLTLATERPYYIARLPEQQANMAAMLNSSSSSSSSMNQSMSFLSTLAADKRGWPRKTGSNVKLADGRQRMMYKDAGGKSFVRMAGQYLPVGQARKLVMQSKPASKGKKK